MASERCGGSGAAHAVMKDDLAGGLEVLWRQRGVVGHHDPSTESELSHEARQL